MATKARLFDPTALRNLSSAVGSMTASETTMTLPARPTFLSLLTALVAITTAAPGFAQAEDVAGALAAPEPQRVLLVSPQDGATIPTNARVAFSLNFGSVEGIDGELLDGDDGAALTATEIGCPSICVGLFEPGPLLAGGEPTLTISGIEQPTTVSYTVADEEDVTPPTMATPSLTSTYEAWDGEHLGYNLEILVARAEDDYGIAYYEIRTGSSDDSTDELPQTALLMGTDENLQAFTFLDASAAQACVEVEAFDYAGHAVSSERLCEDTVPPTDDELAETIMSGGCFGGGGSVAQMGVAMFGLLLLRRRRRRE